ncbi:MAG: hypothetical protein JOZ49_00405 [Mycolicibacterium sp.]|nr:hypothetical protein [Mycolicibacterium sp.]
MPLVSEVGQFGSQAGQMLSGGGGLQEVMQGPMQAMQPLMSGMGGLGQPVALGALGESGVGAADGGAGAGSWIGAAPSIGGPVSASLSAGAAGAGGGFGGIGGGVAGISGTSTPLSGPVSWSSATVPTTGTEAAAPPVRVSESSSVSTTPAGMSMGGGAMMGPLAAASRAGGEDRDHGVTTEQVMASIANFYREPVAVPVVTGSAGALLRREGDAS